jgi:uncharacterized protein (TIRG00374 family)
MRRRLNRKWVLSAGIISLFGVLFLRSLGGFHFGDIAGTLARLQPWQIGLLLWFNILIFLLFSSRWWLALHALGHNVGYLVLSGYRLVAFGISYFTPGPQIGGEPAQIHLLHKRQAVPVEDALASVSFDKLLEFLANFSFLAIGSGAALRSGLFPGLELYQWFAWVVFLLLLPLMYLVGLWLGARPLGFLLSGLPHQVKEIETVQKGVDAVQTVERQVSEFCLHQPKMVFTACAASLLIWVFSVAEYGLTLRFLGASLSLPQILLALTAARLAFLTPIPGGLGALEAGQVFALSAMGFDPSLGISVAVVIRVRDVLLGSAGLVWGSFLSLRRFRMPAASLAGD